MPEVVEVCLTAQWLNEKVSNKELNQINVLGGRYSRHALNGLSYISKNGPFKINNINSKGKFLWFDLSDKHGNHYYILNRFGLGGEWGLSKQKHSAVQLNITDTENGSKNNIYLYFSDPRNFGTIEIVNNEHELNNILNDMGSDLLKTNFTNQELYERIKKYITRGTNKIITSRGNTKIIEVLMNQSESKGIGCGLGNYLSVEILYDCKISPHKTITELYSNKQLIYDLANSIKRIIKLSYLNSDIGYFEYLDKDMVNYIKKLRDDIKKNPHHIYNYYPEIKINTSDKFMFNVYRKKNDPFGNLIQADKIITGRTTYWCPTIQNK